MKTPEEILKQVIHNYLNGSLNGNHTEKYQESLQIIEQSQKEAYNEAIDDAINNSGFSQTTQAELDQRPEYIPHITDKDGITWIVNEEQLLNLKI